MSAQGPLEMCGMGPKINVPVLRPKYTAESWDENAVMEQEDTKPRLASTWADNSA